jgi:hypothetical protein
VVNARQDIRADNDLGVVDCGFGDGPARGQIDQQQYDAGGAEVHGQP